jgi:4-amino-4-deoxy-L-arabinose transferase-like glycosyltransferase
MLRGWIEDGEAAGAAPRAPLAVAMAVVALWVCALRLPAFAVSAFDSDEALFLLIGQTWLEGGLPYADIWDLKPPGLFLIFAGAEWLLGPGVAAARVGAMAAVGASAIGLFLIGRRWLRSSLAAWFGALAYPAYTIVMNGLRAKAEIFSAPLVIFGCYLALATAGGERSWRGRLACAAGMGLCFGLAMHVKQTAAFEFAFATGFAAVAVGLREGRAKALRLAGLAAAGAALVALAFLAYFAAAGAAGAFLEASYLAPFLRLRGDDVTFAQGLLRILPQLKPLIPLLLGACLLAADRDRVRAWPQPRRRAALFLFGWLLAALPAIVALRAMYGHYFLPLVPSMALLAALAIADLAARLGEKLSRLAAGAATLAAVCYPILYFAAGRDAERLAAPDMPRAVAGALSAAGYRPGDSLYVVNYDLVTYLLAGARPPTRYPMLQHLQCDFSAIGIDGAREVERIFAGAPEFVIKERPYFRNACPSPPLSAAIARNLEADYVRVETVTGDVRPVDIFRRRED